MSKWRELSLLEVAKLTRGTEPGSGSYIDATRGIRFLRVGDITGKTDNPVYTDSSQLVLVSATDVLLSLDGSPGHVSTGHCGAISSGIRKVEPMERSEVSQAWLRYALMSPAVQQTISRYTTGVTILHASSAVPHIRIPVPPLPEQERIVRILGEAEALRRLRAKADERIATAIPAAFFNWFGDPTTNTMELPTVKLGDVAKLERGRFTPRPRNDPSYFDGEYPFIQTGDISNSGGLTPDVNSGHETLPHAATCLATCLA
jgi:restriction endonuclease S subunit